MIGLYNVLLILLAPVWMPWMRRRANRRDEPVSEAERHGHYDLPAKTKPRLWIHAVSVGEAVAARPILKAVRDRCPDLEIILSVTTSSGHKTAREGPEGLFDHLIYFPIDLPWIAKRAVRAINPDVLAIMETELWPNVLREAKLAGTRTMVLNGRLSDRSFPRARKVSALYKAVLALVDLVGTQTQTDAERFRALGAPNVQVLGNCKFDEAAGIVSDRAHWRAEFGLDDRNAILVGSLRAEEFAAVGRVLKELASEGVPIIISPRHLERSDELDAALGGDLPRRSRGEKIGPRNLLLFDTYGELSASYAAADVAVVGGGFARLGGQNIIQPLAHGVPTVHGPHMQNFRDVAALALGAGASCFASVDEISTNLGSLGETLRRLLDSSEERQRMGEAAKRLVGENMGASERYGSEVCSYLG
ncbi:3-deoxy-D-manno-octulosonic acid transferase [soil metagenome]